MPAASTWARRALHLPGAIKAPFPAEAIEPQLPTLIERAPSADNYLYEIKWDGYRIGAAMRDGKATIWTRNLHDWTRKMKWLATAMESLPVKSVVLDGEAIAGRGRKDDFESLQAQIAKGAAGDLSFVAFDVLYIDGIDLRGSAQLARKELLADCSQSGRPAWRCLRTL